jgi:predicted dehydrogenase
LERENVKVGVIGVGAMGRNHVRIYSELKGVEEVYTFDLDKTLLKTVSKRYDASACGSVDSLLEKVDAVSICIPTKHHFDVAKRAMSKNVHCLIEKPVTFTSSEGEALIKLSHTKNDLIVGVGQIERFNPTINEIKNLAVSPLYIAIKRHNPSSSRITDADVITDLMIHDIDLIWNYFFEGKIFEGYSLGNNEIYEILAQFNGCLVSISASRVACKKIRSIYVECDEYTIDGDLMNQEVFIFRKPKKYGIENARYSQENIIEKVLVNKVEPLRDELKAFTQSVKTGTQFPVTLEQAVLNLKIVEQIRKRNGILQELMQ